MGSTASKNTHPPQADEPDELIVEAARAASDKKALEIMALDLRNVASFTDYFLICSGTNPRHVQAVANAVEERIRELGRRPLHSEGYSTAEWILLDYGDLIVHVFSTTARRFYELERLWRDAAKVNLPDDIK
jgi:ribosome-associated protein